MTLYVWHLQEEVTKEVTEEKTETTETETTPESTTETTETTEEKVKSAPLRLYQTLYCQNFAWCWAYMYGSIINQKSKANLFMEPSNFFDVMIVWVLF